MHLAELLIGELLAHGPHCAATLLLPADASVGCCWSHPGYQVVRLVDTQTDTHANAWALSVQPCVSLLGELNVALSQKRPKQNVEQCGSLVQQRTIMLNGHCNQFLKCFCLEAKAQQSIVYGAGIHQPYDQQSKIFLCYTLKNLGPTCVNSSIIQYVAAAHAGKELLLTAGSIDCASIYY